MILYIIFTVLKCGRMTLVFYVIFMFLILCSHGHLFRNLVSIACINVITLFCAYEVGHYCHQQTCQYVECVIKRTPLPSSSLTPSSQPEASRMHPMPRNPASNCGTQYRPQSHFSRWSPPSSVLWCRTCADYATSVESLQLLTKRKGPTVIIYNTVEPLFYDHPQNQIGVVVKEGWSSTRGLTIL